LHEIAVSFMPRVKVREEEGVMRVGVFNGLAWRRSEVVEVDMITGEGEEDVIVYDAEGRKLPSQVLEVDPIRDDRVEFGHDPRKRLRVAFLAEDVPSVGFKFFYVKARKDGGEEQDKFKVEGNTIETPFYKVLVGEDGFIKSILHKELGQEIVREEDFRFGEVYVLEDLRGNLEDAFDPRMPNFTGRIWREGERKFEVSSAGELFLKIRFCGEILSCPLEEEFIFYSHSPQVDVRLTIDWSGEHNRMVRVCFPINCNGHLTYESPFRFCRMNEEELPGTYRGCGTRIVGKWVDISNEEWGVTVGLKQGCCNMRGANIEPVILRSVYCMGDPWYWIENKGLHQFDFRLLPHKGDFVDSNSHRVGWELNCPLQAHVLRVTLAHPLHHEAIFSECEELITLEGDSLVLTTLKKAELKEGFWAARIYNIKGEECEGWLALPVDVKEAYMGNLVEEKEEALPVEGRRIRFKAGPYEILTLLIKI